MIHPINVIINETINESNTSLDPLYKSEHNHTNNTAILFTMDDTIFNVLLTGIILCSVGSVLIRICGGYQDSLREYRGRHTLRDYILSRVDDIDSSIEESTEESIEESIEDSTEVSIEECSICLEAYNKRQLRVTLECKHNFHSHCILSWLQKEKTCPICRTRISIN